MYDKLTKKDIEKMEQEVEHRKLVVRKEALEDVKEARAHGDLSENFEYKAAKKFFEKRPRRGLPVSEIFAAGKKRSMPS